MSSNTVNIVHASSCNWWRIPEEEKSKPQGNNLYVALESGWCGAFCYYLNPREMITDIDHSYRQGYGSNYSFAYRFVRWLVVTFNSRKAVGWLQSFVRGGHLMQWYEHRRYNTYRGLFFS